jgi:hypothetical protein
MRRRQQQHDYNHADHANDADHAGGRAECIELF